MSSQNDLQLYPSHIRARISEASQKYVIRPYELRDYDQVRTIFAQGMLDYPTINRRTPFPAMDDKHRQHLNTFEQIWADGYGPYVDYCLEDANMSEIHHYWNINRRSIMLVAHPVGQPDVIHGICGLQPFEYNREFCKVAGARALFEANLRKYQSILPDDLPVPQLTNSTDTERQSKLAYLLGLCKFAIGSLPNTFYHLDDPIHDPTTFNPLPTVILPVLHNTQPLDQCQDTKVEFPEGYPTHNNDFIPFPPDVAQCKCQQIGSKCKSRKFALKCSRMGEKQRYEYIAEKIKSAQVLQEHFCDCILNAEAILYEVTNNNNNKNIDDNTTLNRPILCPYCIADAQYLVYPYQQLPSAKSNDTTTTASIVINPMILQYPNQLSLSLEPHHIMSISTTATPTHSNTTNDHENILFIHTKKLSFHSGIPHGFHRRFLNDWANVSIETLKSTHFLDNQNEPSALATFNSVPIDSYTSISTQRDTLITNLKSNDDNNIKSMYSLHHRPGDDDDNNNNNNNKPDKTTTTVSHPTTLFTTWQTHLSIDYGIVPNPDSSTTAELRRMSISRDARGSCLAPYLFFSALLFAKIVLKYQFLKFSTSYVMDMAMKYYKGVGVKEMYGDIDAFDEQWPVSHFEVPLSQVGIWDNHIRWDIMQPYMDGQLPLIQSPSSSPSPKQNDLKV